MKYNFIKSSDQFTITTLLQLGFQKVDEQNGVSTFINTDKIQFSNGIDQSKIQYSNMLYI